MEMDCCRKSERTDEEKKDLMSRINRIEGQMKGVRKMIEEDKYCFDVITQLTAIEKAVRSLTGEMADHHLRTCITRQILDGDLDALDEVSVLIKRLG